MSEPKTDLLGQPLSDVEQRIVEIHTKLQELLAQPGLSPCVESNTRHALAASWQMMTDLCLDYDPRLLGEDRS